MPIIRASQRQVEAIETSNHSAMNHEEWISEPGGLTQFGAFIHVLQPGTRSSIKHWHQLEDELVYVLDGELTIIQGDDQHLLRSGDAATFPHGAPLGHFLWNKSTSVAKCLIVGTRAQIDRVTYPDHDRVMYRDRSLSDDLWTDLSGNPADSPYKDWMP